MPDSSGAVLSGESGLDFSFRTDLRDEHGGAPGLIEWTGGAPLALPRAFLLLVARGARVHGAGLHLLATRQRAVPRGRS